MVGVIGMLDIIMYKQISNGQLYTLQSLERRNQAIASPLKVDAGENDESKCVHHLRDRFFDDSSESSVLAFDGREFGPVRRLRFFAVLE